MNYIQRRLRVAKTHKTMGAVIYSCFGSLWLVTWLALWYYHLYTTNLACIAFFGGIAYLVFTALHAWRSPLIIEEPDRERELLGWITQYLTAFVLTITIIMLVGVELAGRNVEVIRDTAELRAFFRFEFLALAFVLIFVLPTY
jgi:hypothetical protein